MGDCKINSLKNQIESLMRSQANFPEKLKQRLVLESTKVTNPFKFIASLVTEGVLCDGSNDPEANFGLKEIIVQLAIMTTCAKGADAIGGLMAALEASGNTQVISTLGTWVGEHFDFEANGDASKANGNISAGLKTPSSENSVKQVQTMNEFSSNDINFINKIVSMLQEETELLEKLEGHWIAMASQVVNVPEFCSSLVHQNVLDEVVGGFKTGSEQWAAKAIKAACSKKAVGSLVVAFKRSGNENFIEETSKWLETSQARTKNFPVLVKRLPIKRPKEEPKPVRPSFFDRAALPDKLLKVATFNCQPDSKESLHLEFNENRMIVNLPGSAVKLWNWIDNKQQTIKLGDKVELKTGEAITSFQYDDEILVLGTSVGTVYLFDARTFEEKWSIRLGEPIKSLKFVESSSIIIRTRGSYRENAWWVGVSRSNMQLLNQKSLRLGLGTEAGILNLVDLIKTKRVIVLGCTNGSIQLWRTCKLSVKEYRPFKTLRGHYNVIVNVSTVNGHLISVDQRGKLLMWSGHDLENASMVQPVPRVLAENFHNVTCLFGYERWFATSSSKDGVISVWTLPDLWLRTG